MGQHSLFSIATENIIENKIIHEGEDIHFIHLNDEPLSKVDCGWCHISTVELRYEKLKCNFKIKVAIQKDNN